MGVDRALEAKSGQMDEAEVEAIGAGDQGLMFGYACDETPVLMPMPIYLAHRIAERLAEMRKAGVIPWLRPDGKSQVSIEYCGGRPERVDTVLVSAQHHPDVTHAEISEAVIEHVIMPVLPQELVDERMKIYVNPTGRFVIGGPQGDAGLTGRKIIVDTYGGMGRHGGGAFSGKDPTKVDRSAAYAARWVAKNVVAAGLASRCELQVAYAIGLARPISLKVDTFGKQRAFAPAGRRDGLTIASIARAPSDRIRILEAATPGLARKIGRRVHPDDRWEWEQYNVMFRLLKIKFSNPDLRDKLLATGDEYLVFSNDWHDTIWGVCKCGFCPGGRNALGKLLVKLRKELRCHTNAAPATSVDQSSRKKNTGKPASASTGKSSDCGSG